MADCPSPRVHKQRQHDAPAPHGRPQCRRHQQQPARLRRGRGAGTRRGRGCRRCSRMAGQGSHRGKTDQERRRGARVCSRLLLPAMACAGGKPSSRLHSSKNFRFAAVRPFSEPLPPFFTCRRARPAHRHLRPPRLSNQYSTPSFKKRRVVGAVGRAGACVDASGTTASGRAHTAGLLLSLSLPLKALSTLSLARNSPCSSSPAATVIGACTCAHARGRTGGFAREDAHRENSDACH
jgi:hypothetical protein